MFKYRHFFSCPIEFPFDSVLHSSHFLNTKFNFHQAEQELLLLKEVSRAIKSILDKLGVKVGTGFKTKVE
jgi:hypothetical protein